MCKHELSIILCWVMSEQLFRTLPNFPPVCGAFFSFASRSTFQYSFSFKMALCFSAASAFLFPNYHHFRVLVTSLLQVWRQQRVRYPKSLRNNRLFVLISPPPTATLPFSPAFLIPYPQLYHRFSVLPSTKLVVGCPGWQRLVCAWRVSARNVMFS